MLHIFLHAERAVGIIAPRDAKRAARRETPNLDSRGRTTDSRRPDYRLAPPGAFRRIALDETRLLAVAAPISSRGAWRTWDSIPKAVLWKWLAERDAWLAGHGIDPHALDWQRQLDRLDAALVLQFRNHIAERWNNHLDACHGACVLRRPELADIVAGSLRRFDGDRYELADFIVMPNHVHVLAAFHNEAGLLEQCESWKHYTAAHINRALGGNGRFWQQDGFDHLVRSVEQFESLRRYIAENPQLARLSSGEYMHFRNRW